MRPLSSLVTRQFFLGSAFFVVASGMAGLLNYLFQVQAARQLSSTDFGAFNSWLASVSIALSLGAAVQVSANFFPLARRSLIYARASIFSLAITSTLFLLFFSNSANTLTLYASVFSMTLGIAFCWLLGQLQARMSFVWMGVCTIIASAAKLGFVLTNPGSAANTSLFILAFPVSLAAACIIAAIAPAASQEPEAPAGRISPVSPVLCSLILALSTTIFPQLDFLAVTAFESTEGLGQFARVGLFAKGIFFGAALLLQITLPVRMRMQAQRNTPGQSSMRDLMHFESLLIAACVIASFGMWLVGPILAAHFLGFSLEGHRLWILLSCLNASLLYWHLRGIQERCTKLQWSEALIRLGLLLIPWAIVRVLGAPTVDLYLGAACVYYSLAALFDRMRKSSPQAEGGSVTSVNRYLDLYSDAYHRAHLDWAKGETRIYRHYRNEYASLINPAEGMSVLEFGCSSGKTTRMLLEAGCRVVAVDFDARAVDMARDWIAKSGIGARAQFHCASAETVDIKAAACEVITMLDFVEHVPDEVLIKILNNLRSAEFQGSLLVYTPERLHFTEIMRNIGLIRQDPTHINLKSEAEWTRFFEAHGMQVESVKKATSHWPILQTLERWLAPLPGIGALFTRSLAMRMRVNAQRTESTGNSVTIKR